MSLSEIIFSFIILMVLLAFKFDYVRVYEDDKMRCITDKDFLSCCNKNKKDDSECFGLLPVTKKLWWDKAWRYKEKK